MNDLQTVLDHLHAGRWNEAHNLVQSDSSERGAWLHGIVHIVEGDLEDAEYWYTQANRQFRSRGTLNEELERFARELANAPDTHQKGDTR
ncbi:MAG: hypothetical protein CVU36_00125 [Betaproteobacteria bacterium HGW-Betaproteobacteria-9]|nr:hypothetical protein [Hydrogenophaga sp.]PKO32736.1 MAG: hypothetical protein CVU36_00125 [Betaproteobacteria bacterium HGW-Betaproteobacteria-9]